MKQKLTPHRPAWAALFAVMTLPATALSAQDVAAPPIVNVTPPPIVVAPAPPPVAAPAPPPVSVAPPPRVAPAPLPVEAEAAPAPRTARAAPPRARATAPVRRIASAPAPAPVAQPVAAPEAAAPAAPVAVAPPVAASLPADVGAASASEPARPGSALWLLLIAGTVGLVAAITLFARRRRRAAEEYYEEETYYEPAYVEPEPVLAEPAPYVAAAALAEQPAEPVDSVAIGEPAAADVAAMAAESEPVADRPWLELLLRPIRAGTTDQDAIVEFELTVGNTGSVAARDVRISSWMFAAGSAEESDMERMLIDPPAESRLSEADIAPGDGTRVETSMALSCSGLGDEVTPVVVADARYTLPDGSEGRTSASFAIGTAHGDELEPFALHNAGGMRDDVGARLHGTPVRD
jgi:hypothetical protein